MKMLYEELIKHPGVKEPLLGILRDAIVIKADNVADYFFSGNDKDVWDITTDFPNIAPPFEKFYIEFGAPEYLSLPNGKTEIIPSEFRDMRFGLLFVVQDAQKSDHPGAIKSIEKGLRWLVEVILFLESDGELMFYGNRYPYMMSWQMGIGADGSIWKNEKIGPFYWLNIPKETYASMNKEGKRIFDIRGRNFNQELLSIALLTISFMHCKNVQLIAGGPGTIKGKRNRYGPKIKYYTLEIEPMKTVLKTEGNSETIGLKRSLHICRGHFKDYREHGLFGKFKEVYWWDSQVRGNISQGVVNKDYYVNPESRNP
jgi:hypothetical protein